VELLFPNPGVSRQTSDRAGVSPEFHIFLKFFN